VQDQLKLIFVVKLLIKWLGLLIILQHQKARQQLVLLGQAQGALEQPLVKVLLQQRGQELELVLGLILRISSWPTFIERQMMKPKGQQRVQVLLERLQQVRQKRLVQRPRVLQIMRDLVLLERRQLVQQ
jgi:hypothetical protein